MGYSWKRRQTTTLPYRWTDPDDVIPPIEGHAMENPRPIEVLLVEDSEGDIRLTKEAFLDADVRVNLSVARDGEQAMAFLRRQGQYANAPQPSLILLDLNMPRKDGREVLAELKSDPELKMIPVVVLTTSDAESDVSKSYGLHANGYVTKPVDLGKFLDVIHRIEDFWLDLVRLPRPRPPRG
jgi:CheY-like chemotaxis protein